MKYTDGLQQLQVFRVPRRITKACGPCTLALLLLTGCAGTAGSSSTDSNPSGFQTPTIIAPTPLADDVKVFCASWLDYAQARSESYADGPGQLGGDTNGAPPIALASKLTDALSLLPPTAPAAVAGALQAEIAILSSATPGTKTQPDPTVVADYVNNTCQLG